MTNPNVLVTDFDHDEVYKRHGHGVLPCFRFFIVGGEIPWPTDCDIAPNGIWALAEAKVQYNMSWHEVAALAARMRAAVRCYVAD